MIDFDKFLIEIDQFLIKNVDWKLKNGQNPSKTIKSLEKIDGFCHFNWFGPIQIDFKQFLIKFKCFWV